MSLVEQNSNERVAVQLKTLVNLAKSATLIKLHKSRIKSSQSGGFLSRFKGRGMEFDEARLYQPGDDIRSIDWRVTARTGKTHTKIFREERERPVFISVDHRSTMTFATRGVFKSVQAAKIAALLAWTAQQKGDRIGGQCFTETQCQELKPQNGKHGVLRFFNSLVQIKTEGSKPVRLQDALARLVQHARPGSLVYIISDFRGLEEKSEHHLARLAQHCDVVLIHVSDPLESHLPAKGRYRFTDESRDIVVDSGDKPRILNYQQHYQQRLEHLQAFAKSRGLALLQCSTSEDPVEILR